MEDVVHELQNLSAKYIVIRSTVLPGTSKSLGVYFMPEFLTERNFIEDFQNSQQWIIGVNDADNSFKEKIKLLFRTSKEHGCIMSDNVLFTNTCEVELIKNFRNTFLATKVAFCNEFASICKAANVEYENVLCIAATDSRIGESHAHVPGPDGLMGFGGTCFPKDIQAIIRATSESFVACPVLEAVVVRNERTDRPGKDWQEDNGRAVVN